MRMPARLAIAIPALVALAWATGAALRTGSADAIVYGASAEMATWAASHAQPGTQTWQWVHDDLERAARRTPDNPIVQELLGLLGARRLDRPEYLEEGLVHFKSAIDLRPTSPFTWANIADVKYQLGDTGREFETALVRAATLGPWEPQVQRTVANLGLAVWNEVAPSTRAVIDRMVAMGLRRNPAETLQISERRGRLDVACRHVSGIPSTTESKWSKLCQSTETTS
jgi:hypothetical protein